MLRPYIVTQVVLKEKTIGIDSKNLSELDDTINSYAQKGYRLHTMNSTSPDSKGLLGGDRIIVNLVFEKIGWDKMPNQNQ